MFIPCILETFAIGRLNDYHCHTLRIETADNLANYLLYGEMTTAAMVMGGWQMTMILIIARRNCQFVMESNDD